MSRQQSGTRRLRRWDIPLPANMESHFTEVAGWRMHDVRSRRAVLHHPGDSSSGQMPTILVHGVGLSHRYMMPFATLLAEEWPVYVPDLPGFGFSHKPRRTLNLNQLAQWLAAWMRKLDLPPAALIGNSVGCQVVAELAAMHPHLVRCAVLQGPTVDRNARTWPEQFRRWRQNGPPERHAHKKPVVRRDYAQCGIGRLLETFQYAMRQKLEDLLPQIQCPTLVVRGNLDPIVSQHWAEEVASLLPQGELIIVPGQVAHTMNFAAPEPLFRTVTPFLEAVVARSQAGASTAASRL